MIVTGKAEPRMFPMTEERFHDIRGNYGGFCTSCGDEVESGVEPGRSTVRMRIVRQEAGLRYRGASADGAHCYRGRVKLWGR